MTDTMVPWLTLYGQAGPARDWPLEDSPLSRHVTERCPLRKMELLEFLVGALRSEELEELLESDVYADLGDVDYTISFRRVDDAHVRLVPSGSSAPRLVLVIMVEMGPSPHAVCRWLGVQQNGWRGHCLRVLEGA